MKTINQLILLLTLTAALAGCRGQTSNPLEKYADLKTGLPHNDVSETQSVAPDVFTSAETPSAGEVSALKIQGTNEVNAANFLEGQEGVLYFKILPKSAKITQSLVEITDFPISSRPALKVFSPNGIYGLQWTPPLGVIPPGQLYTTLELKLKTTVTSASDMNLVGLMKEDSLRLIVSRNNSVPKILGRTDLSAGIDEGQSLPFTIDIEDSASKIVPKFPEVQISPYIYSNTEAFRADGSRYVTLDYNKKINPEKISGSDIKWRFYFLLRVDQLPLDRDRLGNENPLAPSVDVCFHARAMSVLQTQSVTEQICFKARYAVQLPQLKWDDENLKEVKVGAPTVIKFKILTGNGLGEVSLKGASQQIAGLSGTKNLLCTADSTGNKAQQNCELTWSPSCRKDPVTKKLILKIENGLNGKVKSQSFTREITLVPSEENCPGPAAKAPAKASTSGVKK